jgi:2-keto-4-pentenoate hydratase/2-oxohepta-3-ene-1,7-dioic acid hydratase in catechol pathway
MKLLLFNDDRLGLRRDEQIIDLTPAIGELAVQPGQWRMEQVIEQFDELRPKFEELARTSPGLPVSETKVLAPLPRPRHLLCAYSNYSDRERGETIVEFFYKGATSIVGPGSTVEVPDLGASAYQPEPEIAYVIGKRAKHVTQANALDYVFGYVNFIDVSARGIRGRRTTFLHKGIDDWAPQGPVVVTKDEVGDPMSLQVRLWLNGELQQDYSTASMTHSIAEQIEWLSQYITLMPGDVIACGTHHQGLCNINDGDHVEMEVQGLERLSIDVRSHAPRLIERWRPAGVSP